MKYDQYLLIKLAEEANEVAHAALKAAQFGLPSCDPRNGVSNRRKLVEELDDFATVLAMNTLEGGLAYDPDLTSTLDRVTKIHKYWELVNDTSQSG